MSGFAPAQIAWQCDSAGREIPRSLDFDECYFSSQDGLAETQHVFLKGNQLAGRFDRLLSGERFVIAETGFGVGLNFLATAQLWQQCGSLGELHYISTELFGVTQADLRRAHQSWPELDGISEQLLERYPDLIPGVHRLHFADLKITLDLWFGEASESLAKLVAPRGIDAWFLDGFSPRQNLELWAQPVFEQLTRLSRVDTTAATYSAARVVKQGLVAAGFSINKIGGFGNKRHMIQASRAQAYQPVSQPWTTQNSPLIIQANRPKSALVEFSEEAALTPSSDQRIQSVAVIGAGIAGLCIAYQLASSGIPVTLYEGDHPLSGASGNPRAMLAPKITPYAHAAEHLHTQSFLFAVRFYHDLSRVYQLPTLYQACGVVDQPKQRAPKQWPALIEGYPPNFVHHTAAPDAPTTDHGDTPAKQPSLVLPGAGIISPHQVAQSILSHPLIQLESAKVTAVSAQAQIVALGTLRQFDRVVICAGPATQNLLDLGHAARTTKGQISWVKLEASSKPKTQFEPEAHKFGGYAILDQIEDDLLLVFGATNERNFQPQTAEQLTDEAHLANLEKLKFGCPELFAALPSAIDTTLGGPEPSALQGRASTRFQLPDHMPLCGPISERLSVISALGSKGFCYAPYAAELLKNQLLGEPNIASSNTLNRLNPLRYLHKPLPDLQPQTQQATAKAQ